MFLTPKVAFLSRFSPFYLFPSFSYFPHTLILDFFFSAAISPHHHRKYMKYISLKSRDMLSGKVGLLRVGKKEY